MEDFTGVLNMIVPLVCIAIGIALVVLIIELIRTVKVGRTMLSDMKVQLDPTMVNVKQMTTDLVPTVKKIEPVVDRVQLTLDAVNLEMMRVDEILEDVAQITDAASSATEAVETMTNAPVKAVNNVASRVRTKFGTKSASNESAKLAEEAGSVEDALKDYREAEAAEAKAVEKPVEGVADAAVADEEVVASAEGQAPTADAQQVLAAMDALASKADAPVDAEQDSKPE